MAVVHMNADAFQKEVIEGKKTALIDFSATWCGPCKAIAPLIDEIAEEVNDDILVGKIDIDESLDIAKKFFVLSVPTIVAFKDGQEVARTVGVRDKSEYVGLLPTD